MRNEYYLTPGRFRSGDSVCIAPAIPIRQGLNISFKRVPASLAFTRLSPKPHPSPPFVSSRKHLVTTTVQPNNYYSKYLLVNREHILSFLLPRSHSPFTPTTSTPISSPCFQDSPSTEMSKQNFVNNSSRASLPVFANSNTLIEHFNIPSRLPVPPRVNTSTDSGGNSTMVSSPSKPSISSPSEDIGQQSHHTQPSGMIDFPTMFAGYVKMLNSKPGEESTSATSHYGFNHGHANEAAERISPESADLFANSPVMDYLQQRAHWTHNTNNQAYSNQLFAGAPMNTIPDPLYLTPRLSSTTPVPDAVHEPSPYETPYDTPLEVFLNTPAIDSIEDLFITSPKVVMTDPNGNVTENYDQMVLFSGIGVGECPAERGLNTNTVQNDLAGLIPMSPSSPAMDHDPRSSPFLSPGQQPSPVGTSFESKVNQSSESVGLGSDNLSSNVGISGHEPTGTRKGVTVDQLVPYDAPTQSRIYHGPPSATSRKVLPAQFERKRKRQKEHEDMSSDEEDELFAEASGEPGVKLSDKEEAAILAKRRQNTLAARRSRARKLAHQKDLEERCERMKASRDMWKMKALIAREQLMKLGHPEPYATEDRNDIM
ncbi:cross-pathway control [Pyrrhoderma noxium]|uniref:Cross-pathway control n=1 Tax=Pyrrhoderma noxium TaxID=2282107 RepID=A0A286UL66_9AGAM|nr:cross-pathway control [Pyrrhoderma noxium]